MTLYFPKLGFGYNTNDFMNFLYDSLYPDKAMIDDIKLTPTKLERKLPRILCNRNIHMLSP